MTASSRSDQWNVLELSSFQLETHFEFRGDIAVLPECDTGSSRPAPHVSRNYAGAKARLFETQAADAAAVSELGRPGLPQFCRANAGGSALVQFVATSDARQSGCGMNISFGTDSR